MEARQSRKTLKELVSDLDEERCRSLFSKVANKQSWFKAPQTSAAVGELLYEKHPTSQIVKDAENLWSLVVGLMSPAVIFEDPKDGERAA